MVQKFINTSLICLGCVCLTACVNDWEQQNLDSVVIEPVMDGKVIVDYTLGELTGRSFSESLSPEYRISSLTYLLYQDGQFVKMRSISDINENTQWPLTRDNMTWAQRQELKDTLSFDLEEDMNVYPQYTAIFIANCPLQDESGKEVENPLLKYKGANGEYLSLDQIYLMLPSDGFKDNTMFYWASQDIPSTETPNRDEPYNCSINLQRVVSRLDISRKEPVLKIIATSLTNELLDDNKGVVQQNVSQSISEFAEKVQERYNKLTDKEKYSSIIGSLVDWIKKEMCSSVIESIIKPKLSDALLKDFNESDIVKLRVSSWNEFSSVKTVFSQAANIFYINNKTFGYDQNVPLVSSSELNADGSMTAIAFGNINEEQPNVIQSITLTKEDGTTLELTDLNCSVEQGGNTIVCLECNPFEKIELQDNASLDKDFQINLDFADLLNDFEEGSELKDDILRDLIIPVIGNNDSSVLVLSVKYPDVEDCKIIATLKVSE